MPDFAEKKPSAESRAAKKFLKVIEAVEAEAEDHYATGANHSAYTNSSRSQYWRGAQYCADAAYRKGRQAANRAELLRSWLPLVEAGLVSVLDAIKEANLGHRGA